jgi:hypothetical protein
LQENSSEMDRHFEKMGSVLFYNKKPGVSRLTNTPAFLTRMDTLLADTSLYDYIASRPVTYLAQAAATTMDSLHPGDSTCGFVLTESAHYAGPCDANAEAMVTGLGANLFEIKTKSAADGILVLLQSHHHSWKAWIDDKPVAVQRVNIAFMGVEVPKGAHTIVFKFVPGQVKNLLWLQVFTLVALLGIAIWSWQRKQRLRVR